MKNLRIFVLLATLLANFLPKGNSQCDNVGAYSIHPTENTHSRIVYRVQVMRLSNNAFPEGFHEGLILTWQPCSRSYAVYGIQTYDSKQRALGAREEWRNKGYKDAFIVVERVFYSDNETVSIEKAQGPKQISTPVIKPKSDSTSLKPVRIEPVRDSIPVPYEEQKKTHKEENRVSTINYNDTIFKSNNIVRGH